MSGPTSFSFGLETTIRFGIGSSVELGPCAAGYGQRIALVAGRRSFADSPFRPTLESSLAEAGVEIAVQVASSGEPELADVLAAGMAIRSAGVEAVVAIGGGSTLDLAKAAALAAVPSIDLQSLLAGERREEPGLPVVAVPTTAGSGAEVSRGAIVLDRRCGKKRGIRGRGVAPRAAIVDPQLVASCPAGVTARAGFDAVAHALETTVSLAASAVTRLLAVEALAALLPAIPRSMAAPDDLSARSAASYGALLMGINLANSTTCLPHRMQYPLGAATGSEHAVGVAALMPAWLERVLEYAPARLAALAEAVDGVNASARDSLTGARLVAEAVLALMHEIELRPRLRELGLERTDLARLAMAVEGTLANDPGPIDPESIRGLYEASF